MLDLFWIVLGLAALYTFITKLGFGLFAEKVPYNALVSIPPLH